MLGHSELSATLVCPNQSLADDFKRAAGQQSVEFLEELSDYPTAAQLEARLRQLRPTVLFIDLGTDLESALSLVAIATALSPAVYVVGLDSASNANVIIRSLRSGATEFLATPFDTESVQVVLQRIRKLCSTQVSDAPLNGKVFGFVGVKAGQGVTTLSSNVAAALSQEGKRKTLLVDFDTIAGSLSFSWRLTHSYSVVDALAHADKLDDALWSALVTKRNGVDVLLSPDSPDMPSLQPERYQRLIDFVRSRYDYVVLDLPTVHGPASKSLIGETDHSFVVCNSELPSLHLTRKAISAMEQGGLTKDRFSLIVNRMSRRGELGAQDMERVFNFPISHVFPDDTASIHRALTAGKPIATSSDLGRKLVALGQTLSGDAGVTKKKASGGLRLSALLSNG
jgi:pilus assembly protein CpaE